MAPVLKLRKGEGTGSYTGYDVLLDGEKAGWVVKFDDGWSFYASVREPGTMTRLDSGARTRRMAIWDGLGWLRVFHLGRIYRYTEDFEVETIYFSEADLKAVEDALMDEMYPEFAR